MFLVSNPSAVRFPCISNNRDGLISLHKTALGGTMAIFETEEAGESKTLADAQPAIVANLTSTFTFASHQNSFPVIRSIRIENPGAETLEGVRLELTASPPFLRAKTWTIDRVLAGDGVTLTDRHIDLDAAYLGGLNEAERGDISLRLLKGDTELAQTTLSVRLLAREEWGGVSDMAQLLPSFVMPNDPATFKLLKSTAERLAAHGHSPALDGYQSDDPKRTFMLTAAIYSAIASLGLFYAEPPASFEQRGQKIRSPGRIISGSLATCLDTTLLFAAVLEGAGLNPVLIIIEGHAFVGAWLVKRTLPMAVEPDAAEIRKAIAARELIVFETTGVTHRPVMTFEQAKKLGEAKLDETSTTRFVAAIDVSRSRSSGIAPLASHDRKAEADDASPDEPIDLPLPQDPDFLLPADFAEEKPTTATGRIARWQSKLLDLSLRNRLLNFADSKRAVTFLCPDVALLEDHLAGGAAYKLISLPDQNPLNGRDVELHRNRRGEDLHRAFASDALKRNELSSLLEKKELDARLTTLFRQAKNDIAEGGTNTLYLSVGILKWKKNSSDERSYRAPILLLPVKLERTSVNAGFRLRYHEDEPRLNATLLQFVKQEFNLILPDFSSGLPGDENGVDVTQVLERMRHAVRDNPGFEVTDDTTIATFSFAKFLMWKDLTERTDGLRNNRVVRHLIDNPETAFEGASEPFPSERDLDHTHRPEQIVMPLPADSSQLAASLAAAQGRDFVIVGPPGTGKSQTIANMIAACLAAKKTVLFVAEKTAALDVVYRRLRAHGLGDHCLELHSNKADRKRFFAQLKTSWEKRGASTASQWVKLNDRLQIRRDELNAYVEALHQPATNGMSPYSAIGIATRGLDQHAPSLRWSHQDVHDASTFGALEDVADQLGKTFAAVKVRPVLHLIRVEEWTGAWQEQLLLAASELRRAAQQTRATLETLSDHFGLAGTSDTSLDGLPYFANLARSLIATSGTDQSIILHEDFSKLKRAIGDLENSIGTYRETETRLSAPYAPDQLARIPVDDLERDWREANVAIWPKSWFASRRVRRLLGSYANTTEADPAKDLPLIRQLQGNGKAITQSVLARAPVAFAGLDTDCRQLGDHIRTAEQLRTSLVDLGEFASNVQAVAASIATSLNGTINRPRITAATAFVASHQVLLAAISTFEELAGHPLDDPTSDGFLARLIVQMDELEQARGLFRDWSSWCAVRARACALGLEPLVTDLQSGALSADTAVTAFRLGYARWWLPLAIDASPKLRRFRRFEHENAIVEFREIDDLVRQHASEKVVSSLLHDLPASDAVPRNSELGRLRHQMGLQRPSSSIRDMIGAMPESFGKLAPCVLMSPLSIAQYLPTNQALFDVVIFDEASQIATWDAIGAIARGRQTVIVGDPKQLPPTNFFGRSEGEDETIPAHDRDLESILDEVTASGLPVRKLRWHYRSRHESLIAFSNWHYYDNNLITFPSPVTQDEAVSLAFDPTAIYDRGKSRSNKSEARAIVADIRKRLESWLLQPEAERQTLGVITFNVQQQSLIQDLLDDARRDNPALEWFFSEDRIEPVIVKNLENIQGDERDVILFSITFCRDAAGKMPMNFGAINRDGGERRLNVAVTRARRELKIFAGIRADDIDLDRSKALGVRHLKAFLDYAARGAIALPAQDIGSQGPMESPFEVSVGAALELRGWQVVPQVGVSGFRIDLGIKHPDHPGLYLAGVECDGATYHSSATARDRDKVREQVLRGLGWNIQRVWSTDWWFNADESLERLHQALEDALEEDRNQRAEARMHQPATETPEVNNDAATEDFDSPSSVKIETSRD